MNVLQENNSIILKNIDDFNVTHVFDCGQCFRWDRINDNSYIGVAKNKVIVVEQTNDSVILHNTNIKDFNELWIDYFDLNRNYSEIKANLSKDKVLKKAINFGYGTRILNQEIFECLISFIISANNRIPMIKRAVKNISQMFGDSIFYNGKEYHAFPTCEQLSKASIEDLEKCGVGFRAKYIKNAVNDILDKKVNIENLKDISIYEAREELQKIVGVGPKIADCVLLFSAKQSEAFPVDVWVKRIMEYFYSDKELKLNEIQNMGQDFFGKYAGFAQQYLFYYARELKIGK